MIGNERKFKVSLRLDYFAIMIFVFFFICQYNNICAFKPATRLFLRSLSSKKSSLICFSSINVSDGPSISHTQVLKDTSCCENKSNVNDNKEKSCIPTSKSSSFVINASSEELEDEEVGDTNILKILTLEATDEEANLLCWKCLGYRYDANSAIYESNKVFPKWRSKYPQPPDVIGVSRLYDPEVDKPVRTASMDLMRSIPKDYKGGVKSLAYLGFKGFQLKDLTPNKTRRAQVSSFMFCEDFLCIKLNHDCCVIKISWLIG